MSFFGGAADYVLYFLTPAFRLRPATLGLPTTYDGEVSKAKAYLHSWLDALLRFNPNFVRHEVIAQLCRVLEEYLRLETQRDELTVVLSDFSILSTEISGLFVNCWFDGVSFYALVEVVREANLSK